MKISRTYQNISKQPRDLWSVNLSLKCTGKTDAFEINSENTFLKNCLSNIKKCQIII